MKGFIGKTISNYKIDKLIGEGGMSFVYSGQERENKHKVAIKFLKREVTSSYIEDVIRFKREIEAVSRLQHENVIKIYESGEYKDDTDKGRAVPYIIMELIEGKELSDLLKSKKRLKIENILNIIKQVAHALEYVHGNNIIHRDLKPGNIIIGNREKVIGSREEKNKNLQPTTYNLLPNQVKLLDFGLSQIMELTEIKDKAEIVGTFSYMSPEQSGIIRKGVDERSDLYSLGIIFYQMAAGELPFKGEEISQILHQQVAKVPIPPRQVNKDVPKEINEMIIKLLSKEPELRYQSAKGLLHDIEKYQKGEEFIIGENDQKKKISYQTRLVGREEEFKTLQNALKNACKNKGSINLISGDPGIGKSRLIEELRGQCYNMGCTFLVGRCYNQENKVPYQPFRDAMDGYIRHVEQMDEKDKTSEIDRIKMELGDLGEIVVRLNSNMRQLLGETKPLVRLEGERENQRFMMIASDFFCSLGMKNKPCILFLDDLQWSDEGSLDLLEEVAEKVKDSNVLIVGTYRHKEVSKEHSLFKIKQNLKEKELPLEEIHLDIFGKDRLRKLTANLLGEKEEYAEQLSEYVLKKSEGNPFFAINIVRELVEEKAIEWQKGRWQEDWEKIEKLSVPATMIDLILRRIEDLPDNLNKLLIASSVIGREFEIKLLHDIMQYNEEEIVNLVDDAIDRQLLERSIEKGKLLFVHDRVRDGFFTKITKEERKNLHLKIAQVIEKENKDNIEEVLFDLAHHFSEAGDKEKTLRYVLPAAQKAKQGYANDEAIKYYQMGIKLLEEKGFKGNKEWIAANEGIVEVYLTSGKSDETIDVAQEVLQFKKTALEKARIYRKIGIAYFKKGDYKNCEHNLGKGINLLGEKLPQARPEIILTLLKQLITHILHCLFPKIFAHKEGDPVRAEDKEKIWFYLTLNWMYILSNIRKFICSDLTMINIGESKLGKSDELGMAVGVYASLCMAIPIFKRAILYHNRALELRKELKDEWGIAQSYQWLGYCYSWKGESQNSQDAFEQSQHRFERIGDLWELAMVMGGLGHGHCYRGDYDKAINCYSYFLKISRKNNDKHGIGGSSGHLLNAYIEKGDFHKAEEHGMESLDVSQEHKIWFVNCFATIRLGYLELERNNTNKAIEYLEKARKLFESNRFLKDYTIYLYTYLAEAYIQKYQNSRESLSSTDKKKAVKRIKYLASKALKVTKPWANHHGGALRVMGKYYALIGESSKAEEYILSSIEHTHKLERRFEEAKGYYEYGRILSDPEKSREQLKKAFEIFKDIGARERTRRIGELLGLAPSEIEGIKESESAQERLTDRLELASVISVSQHLSSILDLDLLLEKIMDTSIVVTGAERGFLFLYPTKTEKEPKPELELKVWRNVEKESIKKEELGVTWTLIKKIEETKEARLVVDASSEDDLKGQKSVIEYGLKSIMCVPLIARNKMLGIIYLDNRLVGGLFTKDKLEVLKTLSVQAAISIQNANLVKNMVEQERLQKEMQLGREIQMNLVPIDVPKIQGLQLAGFMLPAKEIGGDYYDFIVREEVTKTGKKNGKLGIIIGDVSGKGLGAGMLMASAKAILQTLSHEDIDTKLSLIRLNNILLNYTKREYMMTMLFLEWDSNKEKMVYTGAGHEEIIIYRKDGTLDAIMSGGIVLGMIPDISAMIQEKELAVNPGDKVVLYTDGVTEAKNEKGEFYSRERLIESVKRHGQNSPAELIKSIKNDLDSYTGNCEQYDDITMVVLERTGG